MSETDRDIALPPRRYAEVVVAGSGLSGRREMLTYEIPPEYAGIVREGSIVWVPLRDRVAMAVTLEVTADPPDIATRAIIGADVRLQLTAIQLDTARWIARETATSISTAAALFLPPGLTDRVVEMIRLSPDLPVPSDLTPVQLATVDTLRALGEIPVEKLRDVMQRSLSSVLPALQSRGLLERRITLKPLEPPLMRTIEARALAGGDSTRATSKQAALLREIALRGRVEGGDGWVPVKEALRAAGASRDTLNRLARHELVEIRETERRSTFLTDFTETPPDTPPALTAEQQRAWDVIEPMLVNGDSTPVLLRGVTGSGKTELYLRAAARTLRDGRSVLILAPEIALASQLVHRIAARFPNETVVLHSALSPQSRQATWQAVARGERKIVVGPRSALFAPVADPGLIVLDEEHEPAYKQENDPRYHARAVAEYLAARHGAVLLLGSATPSLESAIRASRGEIREIRLQNRVSPAVQHLPDAAIALPEVELVDLRLELHQGNTSLFSRRLHDVIGETLARHEQVLLFLNRRGSATVVLCNDCGQSLRCPYCDIPHVYHEDRRRLICHRCGFQTPPPTRCPICGGQLNFLGVGTQRLTRLAELTFPGARVARWDQDSVRARGAQERLLHALESRQIDIIVGTQMIAKGLDLPYITAVGVIQADTLLQLPDFRAAERTFQLLAQVAGRAGRRRSGGQVIVQTFNPAHYAIQAAARHDFDAFFTEEVLFRRQHRYPPFTRLVRYVIRRGSDEQCASEADALAYELARHARNNDVDIDLMGPVPAFAHRIAGQHQWQLIMRASPEGMERLLDDLPVPAGWIVDVDPLQLL